MFEIREGLASINDVVFQTFERDASEAGASFEVQVGTTGLCGGDEKSGSRALFQIKNDSADCGVKILKDSEDHTIGFAFLTFGDDEILALLKALEFAAEVIQDQVYEIND